jgi:hypothetical protein
MSLFTALIMNQGPTLDSSVPQGKNVSQSFSSFVWQIVPLVICLAIHNYLIAEIEDENMG